MEQIVVASGNRAKLREIEQIFRGYEVVSMQEAGFCGDIEETGATFEENALIKARAVCKALGRIALADDSGLCVEALGGAPGVYSARFCGRHGDDAANNALLLQKLAGLPAEQRTAYFESCVALVFPRLRLRPRLLQQRTQQELRPCGRGRKERRLAPRQGAGGAGGKTRGGAGMKTVVILSDTHYNIAPLQKLSTVLSECDYIIHLGDMVSDGRMLARDYPGKTYLVAGNNDFSGGEAEIVLEVEGRRIFACHGHRYGVKEGTARLVSEAKKNLCDIALYGHTHEADVHEQEGVLVVNPGCMTRYSPRQTYCYLVIHQKKAVATIVDLQGC